MRAGSVRLYRRGKTWWCWGLHASGKRWWRSTHQQDRRAAELAAREIERRLAGASDVPETKAQSVTVGAALQALHSSLRRGERSLQTGDYYDRKLGHVARVFGRARDLRELDTSDVEAYADTRRSEGAARATIAKEIGALRTAMRRAGLAAPRLPDELRGAYQPRERWLTREEYARLLLALAPERREYVIAYVHTGVRESELYAITAADVTHDELFVRGTKTARSRRRVPLSPDAAAVLTRRADTRRDAPLFAVWRNARRDLRAACARSSMPPVSHNDLRRTFASWLAIAGVSPLVVARLLGHASTRMVEQVYARLDRATLHHAVQALQAPGAVTRGVASAVRGGALHARNARPRSPK